MLNGYEGPTDTRQPPAGRMQLLGRDPGSCGQRREIRRRLGYLPQNLGSYPGFTVAEFVEYFALLKEVPAARIPAGRGRRRGGRVMVRAR